VPAVHLDAFPEGDGIKAGVTDMKKNAFLTLPRRIRPKSSEFEFFVGAAAGRPGFFAADIAGNWHFVFF
jgi:hypothetical protein